MIHQSRAINPYFVFLDQFRDNLRKLGIKNIKPTVVAKMCGQKWREMSDAQKSVYIEKAKNNRESRDMENSVK
ncbi:high mobility group B protein 2 [Drosophila obscura]|uniref:high mobility group B protein 2 n=1 Tax=Drosophila obscura TaxID=7282 RepID=UPI001BB1B89B|nr:high mobility group B protein 2 [Drosophila obscura]